MIPIRRLATKEGSRSPPASLVREEVREVRARDLRLRLAHVHRPAVAVALAHLRAHPGAEAGRVAHCVAHAVAAGGLAQPGPRRRKRAPQLSEQRWRTSAGPPVLPAAATRTTSSRDAPVGMGDDVRSVWYLSWIDSPAKRKRGQGNGG